MGLRDKNPLIDSDLELIITVFEKAMIKSRDADSVLVPFRRSLEAVQNFPESVKRSIDQVPISPQALTTEAKNNVATDRVPSPEEVVGDPNTISEDSADEDEWKNKLKKLGEQCMPCDFRTLMSIDAEFFSDIGEKWEDAFSKVEENLKSLGGILDKFDSWGDKFKSIGDGFENGEATTIGNITNPLQQICELGNLFKNQCVPDLKKILFILNNLLSSTEMQVSADLGIFDSFLTSLLSPIFNEMAANLDLIDELALGPVKCILSQIQYQLQKGPETAQAAFEFGTELGMRGAPSRRALRASQEHAENVLDSVRQVRDPNAAPSSNPLPEISTVSRAQERADRIRREVRAYEERAQRQTQSGMQRMNSAFQRAQEALSFLDRFKSYLQTGFDWIEDKKDWLLNLIEEFISVGTDSWNEQISFAQGKLDILDYIAIITALVNASKTGGFSCGPDTESMTLDELKVFFTVFRHPSESLDISLEGDIIVVRRNPTTSGEGGTSTSSGRSGPDATQTELGNVVVRRPISSCLKKITTDQADMVSQWIRQLEQEG